MRIDVDDERAYVVRVLRSSEYVVGDGPPMKRHEARAERDYILWNDPNADVRVVYKGKGNRRLGDDIEDESLDDSLLEDEDAAEFVWQDGSGFIELPLTWEEASSVPLSGRADAAVDRLLLDSSIRSRLSKISDATLVKVLRGYGEWTAGELRDRESNEMRLLWLAALDIQENPGMFRS